MVEESFSCGERFSTVHKALRRSPFFDYFSFVILCLQELDGQLCVITWIILGWSVDRTVIFFNHSPSLTRLSPFLRYQSPVKVADITPFWYDKKESSSFVRSLFLEVRQSQCRDCLSSHRSMSSNSSCPSSVIGSLPLRGMCSLHHFAAPISSVRKASISPAF